MNDITKVGETLNAKESMNGYEKEEKFYFKDGNVIFNKETIIPIEDLKIIDKIINSIKKSSSCSFMIEDKKKFDNIKSMLPQDFINYEDFIKMTIEFEDLINKCVLKGNIYKDNPLINNSPIDLLCGCTISCMSLLDKDNITNELIYYRKEVDDDDIDYMLNGLSDIVKNHIVTSFIFTKRLYDKSFIGHSLFIAFMDGLKYFLNDYGKKTESLTYIMKDNSGYYKIGRSINPSSRLKVLGIGNPTIELCFYINGNHEHELHKKFNSKRVNGEWFRLDEKDLVYIKDLDKEDHSVQYSQHWKE